MPFEIEKAHRTGAVSANDPASGEKFEGTYTGIVEASSPALPQPLYQVR